MVATRKTSAAAKRTAAAAKMPISRPETIAGPSASTNVGPSASNAARRPRIQVLRTPPLDDSPNEEAEQTMLAEVEALERRDRMLQLEERRAKAQRNIDRSSAGSSQTLTGDVEAPMEGNASGQEALSQGTLLQGALSQGALSQGALSQNTGRPDFLPLTTRFSAVNEEHFKSIAENKFRPENICKLSNDHAAVRPDRKYIRMGDIDLQTRDDDASASDTKGIMQLSACFTTYIQILTHFANPAIRDLLYQAMLFYLNRLIRHAFVRTWESVRGFHFAFHRTCIADGIKDPQVWKRVDANLEAQILVIKPPAQTSGMASGNRNGSNPSNRNLASTSDTPVCFKFNGRGCTMENCRYRHVCKTCGGPHAMWTCGNANTTPIAKRE